MQDTLDIFRNEAREHLHALEEALLELENNPNQPEYIDRAFRAMHTIKGAGGIVGYKELCNFTHHLETVLDKIRGGKIAISSELISVFLDARDHIEELLPQPDASPQQMLVSQALIDNLYAVLPEGQTKEAIAVPFQADANPATELDKDTPQTRVFRIRFTPDSNSFKNGFDIWPVLRELNNLGECYVTTLEDSLPTLENFDPENCYLSWDITLLTREPESSIADAFIFVQDEWEIDIQQVDLRDDEVNSDRLGELLIARELITQEQLSDALKQHMEVGKILQDSGLVTEQEVQAALTEQQVTRATKNQIRGEATDSTVRVPTERLDKLMNLVGELVIVQARLNQIAHQREDESILGISEDLDLLTTAIRDNTFGIRMLPIGTTFGRFRRLVRDMSRKLNKQIELQTEGADTELDKMMIDKLSDPLVHLIRNSIDHGIEHPDERETANKSPKGTILLSAEHRDSQIVIRISDDGRGLNTDAIQKKAIERGLIDRDTQLTDEQIHQFIFDPGFSTAKVVSDISGRGVGMDVVKRSIQDLGGKVGIQSEGGKGTTLTISLPMTLAIIEGLLIRVAEEHYVLPLSIVEECIEISTQKIAQQDRRRLVRVRGELVPYMRLREWFEVSGDRPAIEQIVIVRLGDERFGFCLDEVVGQYQTVIKRLGKMYEDSVGFSGATILGDGSVAIVLDPQALHDAAQAATTLEKVS